MLARFQSLIQPEPPFDEKPDYNKPFRFCPNPPRAQATFLKLQLVCEIHFGQITEDTVFRHPVLIAMRDGKNARDGVGEAP